MDKVKVYLAILQKYHFWVIVSVVLLASLASWYMASTHLANEFTAKKGEIDGKISAAQGVANSPNHPNQIILAGYRKSTDRHADDVFRAWQIRFQEQLKVPQWPAEDLGKDFVDFINNNPPNAEIPYHFREVYLNYVQLEINKLFDIIDLREPKEITQQPTRPNSRPTTLGALGVDDGGMLGGMQGNVEWQGLVSWPTGREQFRALYYWPNFPTSLQVRYANEDLWVYRALLNIIKDTNAGVKEHLNANIKKIGALNIGKYVPPPAQVIALPTTGGSMDGGMMPDGAMAEGGMDAGMMPDGGMGEGGMMPDGGMDAGMMPGDAGMMPDEGGMPGMGAAPGNTAKMIDARLKNGRYVDSKGKPVWANAPEPYAEFKIMPFQMVLVMDQRQIPDLLMNCANSPLPVEVRQVGIVSFEQPAQNAGGGGADGGMGGMGGGIPGMGSGMGGGIPGMGGFGGGMMPDGGGFGGGGMMMPDGGGFGAGLMPGGGDAGGGAVLGGEVELRPYDLQVEVRGVIYIFNTPDRSKVGEQGEAAILPEGEAGTATDGADSPPVDATAPPGTAPAGGVTPPAAADGQANPGQSVPQNPPAAGPGAAQPGAPPAGQDPAAPNGAAPNQGAPNGAAPNQTPPAGAAPNGAAPNGVTPPAANPQNGVPQNPAPPQNPAAAPNPAAQPAAPPDNNAGSAGNG